MKITIDIETIPDQDLPKDCLPVFDETTVKLGNIKDEAKRAAKIAEARAAFEDGMTKKMSLESDYCRILSIGYKWEDQKTEVLFGEKNDSIILSEFADILRKHHGPIQMIGWGIKRFDLPVLWKRMILNEISPPFNLLSLTNPYNHTDCADLMTIWNNGGMGKLSACCKRLGIPVKTGMDGSMIFDAFKEKKFDEIKAYNIEDCVATEAVAERIL